ncbi:MAG TPA: type III pantothenate kinase [Tenuifilaceae bacterium]|nr:type III pantothenate kinase [Tenuifilaceae bacterium]HOC35588.1 type III pantothenate kinase [Tenuifilaceae bacterium]HPG99489.1 type III pantothenate kinase [Tenuifilaceae bacterium]HPM90418.1 type III pantothenate kinase [Tenuifilaceae bacterium]HPW27154.1 type III pantothenate kinase [Tenuifilaceae bacterium]
MNLIIDVGNTQVKVALMEQGEIVFLKSFSTLSAGSMEEILSTYLPHKAIVSVVGNFQPEILSYLSQKLMVHVLGSKSKLPLKNTYETPLTLGYDRIAVAVGAITLYPNQNVLVVDCGTAITYDVVTSDEIYLGGGISPGISLRFKSLNDYTAKLPLLSISNTFSLIGRNTNDCILSGVLNGVVAEVDAYIEKFNLIYSNSRVVLTGGDSSFFVDKLKNSIFVNPNLIYTGLNRILELNAE